MLNAANNAETTLAATITAIATELTVTSASGFPSAPFLISIDNEILKVTVVATNTFTVTREQESTTGAIHTIGVAVENRFTAGMYNDVAISAKVSVSADGSGEYSTIQAALTDNVTVGLLVLVYPGTYTDDTITFTANSQEVRGMGISPSGVNVTTASSNIVNYAAFTGCRINRIKMQVTAGTTLVHTVTGSTGSCNLVKCHTKMVTTYATAGTQPACLNSSGTGTIKVVERTVEYEHSGSNAAVAKALLNCEANNCTAIFDQVNIDINCSNDSLVSGISFGTGATTVSVNRCEIDIEDDGTAIVVGLYVAGAVAGEFLYNTVHVTGTGVLAAGMYINAAGAAIRSMYNHVHVSGATTNNSFFLNDYASTLTSQFDDLIAVDGINNLGLATRVVQVNSEADGAISVSGDLVLKTTQTPATAGATGTKGTIAWDADYMYVCIATDTWERVAIATWAT